jgi:hypothetical protein
VTTCPHADCASTERDGHTGAVSPSPSYAHAPDATARPRRFQPRHALYVALVCVVVVCIVVLFKKAEENTTDLDRGNIERLIPLPNSKMLKQEPIGIDLAAGYEATLTVTAQGLTTPIPDDQLSVVPALNQFQFVPGPGKEFEEWPAGEVCVIATYWQSETGASQSTNRNWCFTVV